MTKIGINKAAELGSAAQPPSLVVDKLVAQRTVFNDDRTHRFTLFRHWGDPDNFACGICMNPSSATEELGDRTVDGMVRRAREQWGVGALEENNDWIRQIAAKAAFVVVGWGNPGQQLGRGKEVESILREVCDLKKVFCFGKNKSGAPVHPLYQRIDAPLIPFFD